jgi:VIT1/CCC1 family predicted Fe2+/Mn2+ transporter
MEREVFAVLGPIGIDEKLSRQVTQRLREVEDEFTGDDDSHTATHTHYSSSATLIDEEVESAGLRWSSNIGLTAFLLKFGEGMAGEEVPNSRMYMSALTIGMGYLIGGIIPLMPYFFIPHAKVALIYSAIVTGITLLVFGAVKTHVSGAKGGWGGYAWGAISTLLVGGMAAAAAYLIVAALEGQE